MSQLSSRFLSGTCGLFWALVIMGYPATSAVTTALSLPNREVSIGVRGIILMLAVGLFGFVGLRMGRLQKGIIWGPLIIFWTLYLLRIGYDSTFQSENLRLTPLEYFLWAVGTGMVPMFAGMIRLTEDELATALMTMLWFGLTVTSLILVTTSLLTYGNDEPHRFGFATLNPINMGHFGLSVAIVGTAAFLDSCRSRVKTLLAAITTVFGMAIAIASSTRSVAVAWVLIWPMFFLARTRRATLIFIAVTVPLIVASAFAIQTFTHYKPMSRILGISLGLGGTLDASAQNVVTNISGAVQFSDNVRVELLIAAWQAFKESPVFGVGVEPLGFYPHNVIVESYLATGLVGGSLFLMLFIISLLASWIVITKDENHYWISLLYINYAIWSMLSGSLYGNGVTLFLTTAVITHAYQVFSSQKVPREREGCRNTTVFGDFDRSR